MHCDQRDIELLFTLADHRVLTAQLLARLAARNLRALRRRLCALEAAGLIAAGHVARRRGPGRLERVLAVTAAGAALLREAGRLDPDVPDDAVVAPAAPLIPHQLMVNELRVHLAELTRRVPQLTARFLSPLSPFLPRWTDERPFVHEVCQASGSRPYAFTPDGVLALTHAAQAKTLLFYVEVDRGTELLGTVGGHRGTVWHKLAVYQAHYQTDAYKRYEQIFGCQLRRFRLLIVAHTEVRLAALCALVREMGLRFACLADRVELARAGVWAPTWVEGGELERPRISIIGPALSAAAEAWRPPARRRPAGRRDRTRQAP